MMVIRGSLERAVRALKADRQRLERKVIDQALTIDRLEGANSELRRTISRVMATEELRRG